MYQESGVCVYILLTSHGYYLTDMTKPPNYCVCLSIICFVCASVCVHLQHASLVFASSSTVYGHHSPLPFSPSSSAPLTPSSVYAATKTSNERFASVFCSEHGLKAMGIRFFTVYGPWGRPDMAVYKFARSMYEGREVVLHEAAAQPVRRDFTFVGDAVRGVLLALKHLPTTCGRVFNVGSGRSVELGYVLSLLKQELNVTAKIVSMRGCGKGSGYPLSLVPPTSFQVREPLPPFDLPSTHADISESERELGYVPSVSVEEGTKQFVSWFESYHGRKQDSQRHTSLE